MTLPAGQTSVNFTATLLDDHVIESGPTPVTVTSHVENWTDGARIVSIVDDDRTMTVTVPASGWEGQTLSGTVQLGGTLTTPLTVSLSSSNVTQLTLPATVTIAAGATSATFTATLVDNGLRTGPQTEQITATASGLSTANASMVVDDADVDHFTFTTISGPQTDAVPFSVTATAYDFVNNVISVYNGTATLTGTGTAGALSISPVSVTFASGVWTGNVTVNAADPTVTLHLSNGAGITSASNTFVVQPGAVASLQWSTLASAQTQNVPFSVTLTAKDVNGYTATGDNGTATLSGLTGTTTTGTILGQPTPTWSGNYGTFTMGYSFTPSSNLLITGVEHYFGSKISIWTDSGTLLASQTYAVAAPGWAATPLSTPITLLAGTTYRIAAYSAGQTYYLWADASHSSPLGTIGQEYEVSGDGFPTNSYSYDWYLVDVVAQVTTTTAVPITPTTATFVNGVWTGSVTVTQAASSMYLHVDDGSGHTANSNTFNTTAHLTAAPSLLPDSDTGASHSDGVTNLNNSDATKTLQFSVPDTTPGATVTIYADGIALGSAVATDATTVITTIPSAALTLADGSHVITARQTVFGEAESDDSVPVTISVDTAAPTATANLLVTGSGAPPLPARWMTPLPPSKSASTARRTRPSTTTTAPGRSPPVRCYRRWPPVRTTCKSPPRTTRATWATATFPPCNSTSGRDRLTWAARQRPSTVSRS